MVSAQIFVLVNLLLQMFTFSPERFLTHCLCGFLASKLFCPNQLCKLFCNNSVPPPPAYTTSNGQFLRVYVPPLPPAYTTSNGQFLRVYVPPLPPAYTTSNGQFLRVYVTTPSPLEIERCMTDNRVNPSYVDVHTVSISINIYLPMIIIIITIIIIVIIIIMSVMVMVIKTMIVIDRSCAD